MTASGEAQAESRVVGGRYALREALGKGGMGTVWLAEDTVLKRAVAVKEVRLPPNVSDADAALLRERTMREARAAARLDHPAVVRVFDVVEEDGRPWIVMELLQGRTLSTIIREDGPLAPADAARVGVEVLGALAAAHAAGIVHRDVKPGNVLIRDDGRITLTDFGIASTAGDASITSTGLLLGSPAYISPERARGEAPQPASDVWSLGATLYAAVEGKPPFERGEPFATLTAAVTDDPDPFVAAGPLGDVIEQMLRRDPADRPSVAQLRRSLGKVARSGARKPATAPARSPARPASSARNERTAALPLPPVAPAGPAAATPQPHPQERPHHAAQPYPAEPAEAAADAAPAADTAAPPAQRPAQPGPAPAAPAAARPPAAAQGAASRHSGRRNALLAMFAVLVFVIALLATVLLTRHPRSHPAAASGHTPAASASGHPSASPSSAGKRFTSPEGWSVVLPAGWRTSTKSVNGEHVTDLTSTDGRSYLRVETLRPPPPDPAADWRAYAGVFASSHAGYHLIGITSLTWRGWPSADWEFTYQPGGGLTHVVDREAKVDATKSYALLFQAPDAQWQQLAGIRQALLASFQPA